MPESAKHLILLKISFTPLKKDSLFLQKQSKTNPIVPSLFLS
jgi:hypothetical protein